MKVVVTKKPVLLVFCSVNKPGAFAGFSFPTLYTGLKVTARSGCERYMKGKTTPGKNLKRVIRERCGSDCAKKVG